MFSKLADLSCKRTPLQAIGFYVAYFILGIILGGIAGAITGTLLSPGNDALLNFEAGQKGGLLVAVLYPPIMSFLILKTKGLLNNFAFILLALSSGILGVFGGAFLGLIPAAFLTTRSK